jgi:hypothetical protein
MFLLISLLFFMTGASYIHFVYRIFEPITYDSLLEEEPEKEKKPVIKYEDKYWDLFKRADNNFVISKDLVIAQRLDQLATCVLFEMTPVGNVIMTYNAKKEAFEYYSDCTIPYRYLDTACRKYAATFGCKPLYIDMNEQVKESEAKTILLRESKAKEKENAVVPAKKKNVFAKFKSYNKDSVRGAPPKNSLPGGKKMEDSEPVVIKEQTNKFLFLGKTMNFVTGKKIEQKVAKEKKVSFADFKKMFKK